MLNEVFSFIMFLFQEPDFMKYQSLYALSLDDIFNNNVALQSFIGKSMWFVITKTAELSMIKYLCAEDEKQKGGKSRKNMGLFVIIPRVSKDKRWRAVPVFLSKCRGQLYVFIFH